MKKVYFKDLTKKEMAHLHEMRIFTLRDFERNATKQAEMRKMFPMSKGFSEPCWDCRAIARKLELPI